MVSIWFYDQFIIEKLLIDCENNIKAEFRHDPRIDSEMIANNVYVPVYMTMLWDKDMLTKHFWKRIYFVSLCHIFNFFFFF